MHDQNFKYPTEGNGVIVIARGGRGGITICNAIRTVRPKALTSCFMGYS